MTVKRINTVGLLEDGKRLNPCDLIIDYRFRILTDKEVVVSVWGESEDQGYYCLGHQNLYKPTDGRVPVAKTKDFNTDIFQLKMHNTVGLFLFIENAEYVEIKRIDFCFNESAKLTGRSMECDPYYPPYPETGYNVSPFAMISISTVEQYIVNPMVITVADVFSINPIVMIESSAYNVNPFVFSSIAGYGVSPFVFVETVVLNVNPFVQYEDSLIPQAPIITIYTVGDVWSNGFVDITSPDGGIIYYEIAIANPPDPTLNSPIFATPSGYGDRFVVKAVVYKNGLWSDIATDSFWVE